MMDVLDKLNRHKQIDGSMLITRDGMIIAAAIPAEVSKESVAAFLSSIGLALKTSLQDLGVDGFTRYSISTIDKRIILMDLGKMFLIIFTPLDIDVANVNVEVFQAANMIKKSGRLD